ncbi:MAG: transglycosylase domain-containing protein [Bacteroidetes bacterium]|nr:transglycosylase domain-containing protein [Bacteroidota bacterium]
MKNTNNTEPKTKTKPKKKTRWVLWIWLGFLATVAVPSLLILLITIGAFGDLPDTVALENPPNTIATEIISEDGVTLGKYYNENRSPVNFDHLSPNVVNALIATEDARFFSHAGIDFKSALRVVFKLGHAGGGSTLTQQLAKNLFKTRKSKSINIPVVGKGIQKLKEWVIATRLERFYTKEEIMAMYLNTVEFGSNAFGIKSAARTFFSKTPDSLSVPQAALLVGLLQRPSAYSPVSHPDKAIFRRNVVLSQMKKYDFINKDDYAKYSQSLIDLSYQSEAHTEGLATYFREYLRLFLDKWCAEHGYDLYTDGLKIYTTIDSRMQKYAEEAARFHLRVMQAKLYKQYRKEKPWDKNPEIIDLTVRRCDRYKELRAVGTPETRIRKIFNTPVKMRIFKYAGAIDTFMSPLDSIKYYKYFLQTGMMAMDPTSGHVKAWVGGVDNKFFSYDHVNPNSKRQVGSTFKPFVYATAIMNKYSPCQEVPNTPVVFEDYDNWSPKNSDEIYGGKMTLRSGLAQSVNCITAWVMKEVGVKPVVELAHSMGIKSKIDPYPAICLGTPDISVFEMTGAFNTFTNKGTYIEPVIVSRIVDKNGNVLDEFIPKKVEAIDERSAYIMVDMLKSVTAAWGTGHRLRFMYKMMGPMAGKTGTTQNNSDAWFMGLTPQLTVGTWVGCEDRAVHFYNMADGQGASLALPIYAYFMQKIFADKSLKIDPNKDWEKPKEDLEVEMDCSKYNDDNAPKEVNEGGNLIY